MNAKYTIEDLEGFINTWETVDIPCCFFCPSCSNGFIESKRPELPPQICPNCDGSGFKIIPNNTFNNLFTLKKFLSTQKGLIQ